MSDLIYQPVEDVLRPHGWTITSDFFGADTELVDGKSVRVSVKRHVTIGDQRTPKSPDDDGYFDPYKPSITFQASGRTDDAVISILVERAQEWVSATDVGREVLVLLAQSRDLSDEEVRLGEKHQKLRERIEQKRVQDFLADVSGYLGAIRWRCTGISHRDSCARLVGIRVPAEVDNRIAQRLGFGHHGGADLGGGITLRSDDGEVSLLGITLPDLLTFLRKHDLMGNVDWSQVKNSLAKAQEDILNTQEMVGLLTAFLAETTVPVGPTSP